MSPFHHPYRCSILTLAIVALVLLIQDFDRNTTTNPNSPSAVDSQPREVAPLIARVPSPAKQFTWETGPNLHAEELSRFRKFQSKVLLKDTEVKEKQSLLGNVKTIRWIESQLSASPKNEKVSLDERLLMIDFLHEALDWRENPVRNDVIDSMEQTLSVNNLGVGSEQTRKILVGDKMELFSILAQEVPERAKSVLEATTDKQLSNIFQYAIKRLALDKFAAEVK